MITEYNALTGEVTRREMTAEEITQLAQAHIEPTLSNDDIARLRQQAYMDRSDSLYIAWQKYLATGDDRAEQARQMWLAEVTKIDAEFPYNE